MYLEKIINEELEKQAIAPRIILDKLRVLNEDTRKSSAYVDPNYVPFYYYLGKHIQPKNFLEIGLNLGFFSSSFFKSCKSVENYLAVQEGTGDFYPKRLALKNVQDNYKNNIDFYYGNFDNIFDKIKNLEWNLIFLNNERSYDKQFSILNMVWESLAEDGLIVIDNVTNSIPSQDAFVNFCKIKNKKAITFKTRYGTGLIGKEAIYDEKRDQNEDKGH